MDVLSIGSRLGGYQAATARQEATSVKRLSSGLRISSAADDPSGAAISTKLQTQSAGLVQGQQNVGAASDALTVADGALETVNEILQRMRSLIVGGRSNLLSDGDRGAINTELGQLSAEINSIAQKTTYNGVPLFADGGGVRTTVIGQNDMLVSGKPFLDPASIYIKPDNPANLEMSFTLEGYDPATGAYTVTSTNTSPDATQTFDVPSPFVKTPLYNDGTHWYVDPASGSPILLQFVFNAFDPADIGKTAFIYSTRSGGGTQTALTVGTGGKEGESVAVHTGTVSTFALGLTGIQLSGDDFGNQLAEYRVDEAMQSVTSLRGTIGAQAVSLNEESTDNGTRSTALEASASSIADANIGKESTAYVRANVLSTYGIDVQGAVQKLEHGEIDALFSRLA